MIQEKQPASPPGTCAVCGMTLHGSSALSRDYLGEVYSFCSDACLKKFLEDPEEYAMVEEEEAGE